MWNAGNLMNPSGEIGRSGELRSLAESARRGGDLAAARKYYEEAAGLLRNSADRLKFAHTVRHLGDVYVQLQNWAGAEACYLEALNFYRSQPASSVLDFANAVRAYAVLKGKTGNTDESRALWAEAGHMYRMLGVAAGVEECKLHAGPTNESIP
jgi:tetratricopeptide (TPR) repeat protein